MEEDLETLLKENRVFEPPKKLVEKSNIVAWMKEQGIEDVDELYKRAAGDPEWFWGTLAEELDWYKKWDKVLEWKVPYSKWFLGGKMNIVHNCLDRHMGTDVEDKVCLYWEGEPGDERKLTYGDMNREVCRFANALKKLGVGKGDCVTIYMPMIPELPMAMLACAKIGAAHSVVFSGFSPSSVADRIKDSNSKLLIACDGYYRRGKALDHKKRADVAMEEAKGTVEKLVVVKRLKEGKCEMKKGRDLWWHELVGKESAECKTEEMDAEDLLFLMYTSGTTGKPKGIMHVHGGYAVATSQTLRFVFDMKKEDVWWCAADIGWITGHSYIVYGPMILGASSVMYESVPNYPEPDKFWEICEKYGVTIFYTAPTAVRMFMRDGEEWPGKHDLSKLRMLGSVGEPINPEAWIWYHKYIGGGRCPIMDTWWQTETGSFMITPLPITPLKPGSATKPFLSYRADVLDNEGNPVVDKGGNLVILNPWPSMLRGIHKEPERYKKTYWSKYEGKYLAGDVARVDKDGYFWIQGRADDVLKIAGHRIGTAEVESALVSHPLVVEAAVVGKPDKIRGDIIVAFVIPKGEDEEGSAEMVKELRAHVSKELGPIAKPSLIYFVDDLPKTRSGKIMRRVIDALVEGKDAGNIMTLKNPDAVEEIEDAIEEEDGKGNVVKDAKGKAVKKK